MIRQILYRVFTRRCEPSFLRTTERIPPCSTGRTRDRITGWAKGSLTYNPFTPNILFPLNLLVASMLPHEIFQAHRSADNVSDNASVAATKLHCCRWYGRDRRDRWRIRSKLYRRTEASRTILPYSRGRCVCSTHVRV